MLDGLAVAANGGHRACRGLARSQQFAHGAGLQAAEGVLGAGQVGKAHGVSMAEFEQRRAQARRHGDFMSGQQARRLLRSICPGSPQVTRAASMPSRLVPDINPINSGMLVSLVCPALNRLSKTCYHLPPLSGLL